MADIRDGQVADIKQAYEGLNALADVDGRGPTDLGNAPFDAYKGLVKRLTRPIDADYKTAPKAKVNVGENLTAGDLGEKVGLKKQLSTILDKAQSGTQLTPLEINALEGAMYLGGQPVSFDGDFTNDTDAMINFNSDYLMTPGANLVDVQKYASQLNTNADTIEGVIAENILAAQTEAERAAAEAAAAEAALKESYNTRLDSILVYNGYLDPAKAGDGSARLTATHELMLDHQFELIDGTNDLDALMAQVFNEDGTTKESASQPGSPLEKALGFTSESMLPTTFREHLESGNPKLVSLAENYMIAKGVTGITADGILDPTTAAAAEKILDADVTIPANVFTPDGQVNFGEITSMSIRGQLLLPADDQLAKYLDEDALETIKHLKSENDPAHTQGMSREEFIAMELIDSGTTPPKYQQFLDDYNAANTNPKLNAVVTVPAITAEHTTLDVNAEVNNPVGVKGNDETVVGGSSILGRQVEDESYGMTEEGTLAFDESQRDLITGVYADAFQQYAAANGGQITMYDAMRISYGINQTDNEMFLNGANGAGDPPSAQEAARIQEVLGFDRDPDLTFDLSDRKNMTTLLQGTYIFENKAALSTQGGGNFVQNYLDGAKNGDPSITILEGSIGRVIVEKYGAEAPAAVQPAAPVPVTDPDDPAFYDQKGLKGTFSQAATFDPNAGAKGVDVDNVANDPNAPIQIIKLTGGPGAPGWNP